MRFPTRICVLIFALKIAKSYKVDKSITEWSNEHKISPEKHNSIFVWGVKEVAIFLNLFIGTLYLLPMAFLTGGQLRLNNSQGLKTLQPLTSYTFCSSHQSHVHAFKI